MSVDLRAIARKSTDSRLRRRSTSNVARMDALRTPDDRFADLPGYPFDPNYVDVDGLRVHYVD